MNRIIVALPIAALALAACTHEPVTPAPAPVVVVPSQPMVVTPAPQVVAPPAGQIVVVPAPAQLRAGLGRIESISSATASAGASVAADETRRFSIRMDDGTVQLVDARAPNLAIGDRVEITRDGYIRSPV